MLDFENQVNPVVLSLDGHHKGSPIRKVALPEENLLVTAAKTVKLYDLNAGTTIRKIDNKKTKIYSLRVVDNFLLVTGDDEGWVKLWDYRVNRGCCMELKECEEYVSDLDTNSEKRLLLASSGEGTLTAFNIRAKRVEPPQSELFDSGFQSVRFLEERNKAVVGAEDGALNIFNVNEWGNISDRYPIPGSSRGHMNCSIDSIELIGDSVIAIGCSDGKVRAVNILPNQVVGEVTSHDTAVEAMAIRPSTCSLASSDSNVVKIFNYNRTEDVPCSSRSSTTVGSKSNFFQDLD
jgi:hypothetical protein